MGVQRDSMFTFVDNFDSSACAQILMLMKETKPELLSPKAYLPYYDGATEHLLEDDRYEIMNTEFDISHLGISSK